MQCGCANSQKFSKSQHALSQHFSHSASTTTTIRIHPRLHAHATCPHTTHPHARVYHPRPPVSFFPSFFSFFLYTHPLTDPRLHTTQPCARLVFSKFSFLSFLFSLQSSASPRNASAHATHLRAHGYLPQSTSKFFLLFFFTLIRVRTQSICMHTQRVREPRHPRPLSASTHTRNRSARSAHHPFSPVSFFCFVFLFTLICVCTQSICMHTQRV